MALRSEAALLLAIDVRHESEAIEETQQEQSAAAPQASNGRSEVMATANIAIQTRERERRNQQRLNMKGLRQKLGTQPRQPDLTGTPWFKTILIPRPEGLGSIMGIMKKLLASRYLNRFPLLNSLTRREKRWRE